MTPEESLARRLAAEVEAELGALSQLAEESARAPRADDTYARRARGSILHDFYNGVERIFERIAAELNGGVPNTPRCDQRLVADMALAIPELRPPVIDDELRDRLAEYRGFRHVFRNVYGAQLDEARLQHLEERLPATLKDLEAQVGAFLGWLLGDLPSGPRRRQGAQNSRSTHSAMSESACSRSPKPRVGSRGVR